MTLNPFHKLSYGLYLVSSKNGGKFNGYIANTAFQVTAEPPQIAISCHVDNLTTKYIKKSGVFAISVLEQGAKMDFLQKFGYQSGHDLDKFENTEYVIGKTGAPIVSDHTLAWFDCKVKGSYDAGTHIVFFGEVIDSKLIDETKLPLSYDYYRDVIKAFAPKNAPTYVEVEGGIENSADNEGVPRFARDDHAVEEKEHLCIICGYSYHQDEGDPNNGIEPGTPFDEIPDDWVCPVCRAGKEYFKAL